MLEMRRNRGDFTLIELLVVIAIIAIFGCNASAGAELGKGKGKGYLLPEQSEADRCIDGDVCGRESG